MAAAAAAGGAKVGMHWFRKGLRLKDNRGLVEVARGATALYPIFILDPWFANPERVGVQRFRFLLESLRDLDESLKRLDSGLIVVRGKPIEVLPRLWKEWGISHMTWEADTEPYAQERDAQVTSAAGKAGVHVDVFSGHTLHDMEHLLSVAGSSPPNSYAPFIKLVRKKKGDLAPGLHGAALPHEDDAAGKEDYGVPSLESLGYEVPSSPPLFPGGESAGLERMASWGKRTKWIADFAKPNTAPTSLEPSTTVMSPYLKFGCVSVRDMMQVLKAAYAEHPKHGAPPTSLEGQLLWREFYYFEAFKAKNYDVMVGSSVSKQIPWDHDPDLVAAWEQGRTGYPWIDACMRQLVETGWLHHLARHAVACFLTRGDLYQSWEVGAAIFDKYLIDSDWALNNGNWLWLSASAYFHQYFRVYSPVAFPKKTDPNGDFIRKWLPAFRTFPKKYIFEPWKAPRAVQEQHGVVVGENYPERIVVHEEVSKRNMARHGAAYKANKGQGELPTAISGIGATQVGSAPPRGSKRQRQGGAPTEEERAKRSKGTE